MPPDYAVPALEKALDILEVLADRPALSQLEIAQAVDRSPSQIFRVLTTLERRGYLYRDAQSGAYSLSLRLFDLSHRQEPLRSLTDAALGPMRELAAATGQSCNLSVLESGGVRVVAQVESPADFGFRVRVGALFPLETTATGAVLSAFGGESMIGPVDLLFGDTVDKAAGGVSDAASDGASDALVRHPAAVDEAEDDDASREVARPRGRREGDVDGAILRRIRHDGFVERSDPLQPSVTDVVFPVLNRARTALAALTVPYVATSYSSVPAERVRELTRAAVMRISASLGL